MPFFVRWVCSLPFLLSLTCWATTHALAPRIDFGWLKATQTEQGWLVTYVYAPFPRKDEMHAGDVLISVDHQRLDELGPIGSAHVLQAISNAQNAIVYRENATVRLNFVSLDERVIQLPPRLVWLPQTYKWDSAAPSVTLPDASGVIRSLPLTGKWTLLHVWDLLCNNNGLDALNEIATPEPSDLRVIGIEQGNRLPDVRSYMTSRGLRFFNLVAEDTESFSKIYDPAIRDILIDPDGRIVFMGAGGDSLRNAYLLYRSQSARSVTNQ